MTKASTPFALQYCQALVEVIDAFKAATGTSDSHISRHVFNHSDGIKTIRQWDGIRQSPRLDNLSKVEVFLREHFDDDLAKSEAIFNSHLDKAIAARRPSLRSK